MRDEQFAPGVAVQFTMEISCCWDTQRAQHQMIHGFIPIAYKLFCSDNGNGLWFTTTAPELCLPS